MKQSMLLYRLIFIGFLAISNILGVEARYDSFTERHSENFRDVVCKDFKFCSQTAINSQETRDAMEAIQKAYRKEDESTFYCVNALGKRQKAGTVCYKDGVLHVAFRGTATPADIFTDLYALPTSYQEAAGKVHKGMYHHFQRILEANGHDGLVAVLGQKLKEVSPETTIMFSGHSMGATVALLAAESFRAGDLKEKSGVEFSHSLKLLQVSSPASFDKNARKYIQEHWGESSLTIERLKDPVSWWFTSDWGAGAAVKVNVKPVAPWFDVWANHGLSNHLKDADRELVFGPASPSEHIKALSWFLGTLIKKVSTFLK